MKRVLFVDVRNSTRSPMAEGWFNLYSPSGYEASSCGTMPDTFVNGLAVQVMSSSGLDLGAHMPTRVSQRLLSSADIVILTGGDLCPDAFSPYAIWDLRDPVDQSWESYVRLCQGIRHRVRELVIQLRLTQHTSLSGQTAVRIQLH